MEFRMLGPLEVRDAGTSVPVGGPKQRAVLAALLLHPDEVVGVGRLAELVWGEALPRDPTANLQSYVSRLRRALGDALVIEHRGDGYVLDVNGSWVDVRRFGDLAAEGRRHLDSGDAARAAETLRRALDLWRGRPLSGIGDVPVVMRHRPRLESARLTALEHRIDADLALGHHERVLDELETLIDRHPLHERFRTQLMLALYRSARQADALDVYRDARATLTGELGVEPADELQDMHQAILRQDPRLDAADRTADRLPPGHQLAGQLTSFVGRHADMAAILELLDDARLITLVGPGGAGKTRLSTEVAERAADRSAAGRVWLLELAPISDPDIVARELADVLGIVVQPGTPALPAIVDGIGDARALLVLDNCEHVIDAAAHLAEGLLRGCPNLQVIATSREALRCAGEHIWKVTTLPSPPSAAGGGAEQMLGFAAVELFVDRARAADTTFALTDHNAPAVADICRRLDGIPLAIEIAAAQVRAAGCERIAQRIQRGVIGDGRRTADPRHQTLRAALDWSHQLLDASERGLLAALSVFEGGFPLEGAERMGSAVDPPLEVDQVQPILGALVSKSLITTLVRSGPDRFRMLEPIRQYAASRLSHHDEASARDTHVRWCTDMVRAWASGPTQDDPDDVDDVVAKVQHAEVRLEREHDNLRAAVAWVLQTGTKQRALDLIAPMWTFWWMHGHLDHAVSWLRTAIDLPGEVDDARAAQGLTGLAFCSAMLHQWDDARRFVQDAVDRYRRIPRDHHAARDHYAYALLTCAQVAVHDGDLDKAATLHREGDRIIRQQVNPWGEGFAADVRAQIAIAAGDLGTATEVLEATLTMARTKRLDSVAVPCAQQLGRLALEQGDIPSAISYLQESLEARRRSGADRLGDFHGSVVTDLRDLAVSHLRLGDRSSARRYAAQGQRLAQVRDDPGLQTACANILAQTG